MVRLVRHWYKLKCICFGVLLIDFLALSAGADGMNWLKFLDKLLS